VLTVLLTRHGHTDHSDPDRYLGQRIHVELTERGRRDARALADRLRSVSIDRIVSSPLERASETALILADGRGVDVERDARLAEFDYGSWEGMSVEEVETDLPAEYALYDANPALFHVGGAENGLQAARRATSLVDDLLSWWGGTGDRTCLLVGHASINRALLAAVTGVPMADYRRRFLQDWTNLTVLSWEDLDGGPMLVLVNDLAHVRGLAGVTWG
jgi:broad specificity phosphatase PhoE